MDPSNKSLPDEAKLIEFSAAFDQHGVGDQLTEIAVRLQLSDAQQQLIADWRQTGLRLKGLPVASAGIANAVMNRITEQTNRGVIENSGQSSAEMRLADASSDASSDSVLTNRKRRRQLAKIVALATSSVAMLYVSLQVATHERSLNRSAEVLAAFSFDPEGWDVVVVTVSNEQAEQLSRDLGRTTASGDLQMLSLGENQDSEFHSVGVMMASKETSQKLLVKFAETPSDGDAEWNPRMVGELGRDELLKRFALSMKTPTKSDMFFREIIVVTSDQDNGFQVTSRATKSGTNGDVLASATSSSSEDTAVRKVQNQQWEGESMLMQMQSHRQRPVLVVLKRRSETSDDSVGPDSQGSILPSEPGFVGYF